MIKVTIEDTENNVLIQKSVDADAGCAIGSAMAMYCASIDDLYSITFEEMLGSFHSDFHSDEAMHAYWITYGLLRDGDDPKDTIEAMQKLREQ